MERRAVRADMVFRGGESSASQVQERADRQHAGGLAQNQRRRLLQRVRRPALFEVQPRALPRLGGARAMHPHDHGP